MRGLLRPPLYRLLRVPRLCQTEPEVAVFDGKMMAVDRPIERQKSVASASSSRESPPKMALRPRCCVSLVKCGSEVTSLNAATCAWSEMADARTSPAAAAKTQASFIPEFWTIYGSTDEKVRRGRKGTASVLRVVPMSQACHGEMIRSMPGFLPSARLEPSPGTLRSRWCPSPAHSSPSRPLRPAALFPPIPRQIPPTHSPLPAPSSTQIRWKNCPVRVSVCPRFEFIFQIVLGGRTVRTWTARAQMCAPSTPPHPRATSPHSRLQGAGLGGTLEPT